MIMIDLYKGSILKCILNKDKRASYIIFIMENIRFQRQGESDYLNTFWLSKPTPIVNIWDILRKILYGKLSA